MIRLSGTTYSHNIGGILESKSLLPPDLTPRYAAQEAQAVAECGEVVLKDKGFVADKKLLLFSQREDWEPASYRGFAPKDGGPAIDVHRLQGDGLSDPRDQGKLMSDDLISLGFILSPEHLALVENSKPIAQVKVSDYDAILFIGGEGPMYTFYNDDRVHTLAAEFYKAGKITGVLCHGTCLLLRAKVDGKLLVTGKTWTGFANSEEKYADEFIGKRMQPFWIEDEANKLPDTNFIVAGRFKSHAVRDGNLITGQQQYSGTAVARLMIEALGV
jgi:putative intracellular protease/amidase